MTKYAIGIGSNLDDRIGHMREAAAALERIGPVELSALYETEPVGGPEQGPYLNAVATLVTVLEPNQLLEGLQEIEAERGRTRSVRWEARTLDLDIISGDGVELAEADLGIPHPLAAEREFVLRPLVDVWPEAMVAPTLTAREALRDVGPQGVDRLASDWYPATPAWKGRVFVVVQMIWFVAVALALAGDGSLPEGSVDAFRLLGVPFAALGAGLAFVASRRLGPGLTAVPDPTSEGYLVETGPYRYVRHPMYGGVSLFLVGTALILDSIVGLGLSLGLFVFFYFKSRYEEGLLRMTYPGYRAYRELVSRRFVPFLF